MNNKYLSRRLRTIPLQSGKTTLFNYYINHPSETLSFLEKFVVLGDSTVHIKGAAWLFDYVSYLKDKGYRLGKEIGFNDGVIYELKKI